MSPCACQGQQVKYVAKTKAGVESEHLTAAAAQGAVRDAGGGTVRAVSAK